MDAKLIVWPVLVQVALTVVLYWRLGQVKVQARRQGGVDASRTALHADAWPESVLKVSNNIRNQFESPMLFFVLVLLLWALSAVDVPALVAAWSFVATRLVHAYIHTGANVVPWRRRVFTLGIVVLVVMVGLVVRALVA